MNTRPKIPANARNLNACVIGSSGSGKTRFWLTPQLLQAHVVYCDEVGTQPEKTADTTADTAEGVGSSRQENVTSEQNRTEAIAEDQRLIERDTLWRKAGYAGIGLIGVLIIFGFIPRKKH